MADGAKRGGASAERVAEQLRDRIIHGDLPPGQPLREVAAAGELGVARTTLRESFRLLAAQGLVEATLYRGAVVKTLSATEVRDIYVARRTLELTAVEESVVADETAFDALTTAIDRVNGAVAAGDWRLVGTASLGFHGALVALLGSERLDTFFRSLAAQLRLAFANLRDEESFQRPWVNRDAEICAMVTSGRRQEAIAELRTYLEESERAVLDEIRFSTTT